MQSNESKSIVWHSSYDAQSPPSKPSDRHVRFIVLSDTHSTEPSVPDGDVLLHSGDLTDMGTTRSFEAQLAWLDTLPHRFKFIIAGNHDFGLCQRENWYATRGRELHENYGYEVADVAAIQELVTAWQARTDKVQKYVVDERVEFEVQGRKWSLYGSPWTPEFGGWAWNHKRGAEAKQLYSSLPNTDILLTHGPPHGLGRLDVLTDGSTSVGCEELADKLRRGDIRPMLHCFGHIHEARGTHLQQWEGSSGETLLVNSSIVEFDMERFQKEKSLHYSVKFQPVIVDIDPAGV